LNFLRARRCRWSPHPHGCCAGPEAPAGTHPGRGPPYDILVRWKKLSEQPIGWNPDLNDGVRLNIRPFMTAEDLRHNKKPKLNITLDKDRGKDVESAPWFKVFKGDRINDHHLSLAEKLAAKESRNV
jgi:hypothetical protein